MFNTNNTTGITCALAEMRTMYMERFQYWTEQDEMGMAAMALSDLADSMSVLDLLTRGCAENAQESLWNMDTAPREYLYDALERNGVIEE